MQGQITTYDNKKGTGRVQGDDGHIYAFDRNSLARLEDCDSLSVEMKVEFNAEIDSEGNNFASELVVLNPEDFTDDCLFIEPGEFVCHKDDLVSGYDVLDRGLYRIERSDRTEENARNRLIRECRAYGANAVVSYKVDVKLKNAFGNGFNIYTASGVPVVLGRRCTDGSGEYRAAELRERLNQKQIKKAHDMIVNTRIGKLVLKGLAAVLLIIFALGFILTGGV